MNTAKLLIDDILSGASLRVVLHPRDDMQVNFPDMFESFELCHIILIGERFFAKTANSHAVSSDFAGYRMDTAYSYAYSNAYGFVVNSSPAEAMVRVCLKTVYRSIRFVPVSDYETIWDSGIDQNVKKVEDAITSGRQLKIALLDEEDVWNVHPVHMPSFYIDKNFFELFTDQDAAPDFFYQQKSLEDLEKMVKNKFREGIREKPPRNLTEVFDSLGFKIVQPSFRSTFYTIRSNGKYLRGSTVLKQENPYRYKALKVFADRPAGK